MYFTTFVQQAEYKLPIQYTKRAQGAPSSSYLPLKLNPAGVIPVIFAGSITAVPTSLIQYFASQNKSAGWLLTVQEYFDYSTAKGMIVYAGLIIAFTFFYTFVQVNPEKTAESLQKVQPISMEFVLVMALNSFVKIIDKIGSNRCTLLEFCSFVAYPCAKSLWAFFKHCVPWYKFDYRNLYKYRRHQAIRRLPS